MKNGSIFVNPKPRPKRLTVNSTHIVKCVLLTELLVIFDCNYPGGPRVAAAAWPCT